MSTRSLITSLLLALCSTLALAQSTEAEVRKIDKAQARITLKHGDIKNLEMPAMTMVFRVRDPSWLDTLNVGDKIRFDAEKIDGNFVVTALRKAS